MSDPRRDEVLASNHSLVVLVRLTVGLGQRVLYGEVVDPDVGRSLAFRDLAELPAALEVWLAGRPGPGRNQPEEPHPSGPAQAGSRPPRTRNESEDPCLPS